MLSYVFMKILEGRPPSYDQRMDKVSGGRVRAAKEQVVSELPPVARVLEIGCGTGELASMMCNHGATVEGFDLSPSMIAVAKERIALEHLQQRFSAREMGVEGLDDLPEASYDAVVSTFVLSELSEGERRFALRHAFRLLGAGGRLIIADEVRPAKRRQRILHGVLRAPLWAATYLATGKTTTPISNLRAEVESAGFTVVKENRSNGGATDLLVAEKRAQEEDK